jgi:hypothetical protein
MTSTVFVDQVTVVPADWLNDVDKVVYQALGTGGVAPTTPAIIRANLGVPSTTGTLGQFAPTTSAQLAAAISDATGTGALLFANTPTLVAPALGTPASGVATNLTGTATALNIGGNAATATLAGNLTGTPAFFAPFTNSLAGDVALPVASTYYDGPFVVQGTTGKWFVSGTVTVEDTTGGSEFFVKLWDGTTVIASAVGTSTGATVVIAISLSGFISAPAGNLRISVRDTNHTSGLILFNHSGLAADSTITAFRVG